MLEKILTEGKEIMESELGFCPSKTQFSIFNQKKFNQIATQRGLPQNTEGLFLPRTLHALIKYKNPTGILPIAIHEYLGHGSFYEHNRYGIQLRQCELQLEQIEKELLGGKIRKGEKFRLKFAKQKEQITEANGAYVINIAPSNPKGEKYLRLAQQLNESMQNLYPLYEGFAVWLEEFILSKLEKGNPFSNSNNPYQKFYQKFKEYESQTGPLTLVTKIGFPKKFDDKKRIKIVQENIKDFEKVKFLIAFGSQKEYSDINIYIIKKDGSTDHILDDNLDLTQINIKDLEHKLKENSSLFEVEIIKNGKLLYGDGDEFEKIKCLTKTLGPQAIKHNQEESKNLLEYAQWYYKKALEENNQFHLTIALINLTYAISYSQCAKMYQNGHNSPLTYKDLKETQEGKAITEIRKIAKNNPTPKKARELLNEWEKKI